MKISKKMLALWLSLLMILSFSIAVAAVSNDGTQITITDFPKTGDYANTTMWIVVMVVALVGIVAMVLLRGKKKSSHK